MDEEAARTDHEGVLAELIEVERRIQAAVRAAQSEAEAKIARAERQDRERSQDRDGALRAALRDLEASVAAEYDAVAREVAQRGEREAARYRDVDELRVEALAEEIARRVAEGESDA